jgi:hypothetical protein
MVENSTDEIVAGSKVSVWEGFVKEANDKLGFPKGTEKRLLPPLVDMGCIYVIERGVSTYPSRIALFKPPTEDLWANLEPKRRLTKAPSLATIRGEIAATRKQLGGVNYTEVTKNFEDRISNIERFLRKVAKFDKYTDY